MPQFTRGELEVMRILWKHGELKPAEIHAHFPRKIKNPSLRSYLAILLEKGHVVRRRVGKAYYYRAKTGRQSTFRSMLQDLARVCCDGSVKNLLCTLIRSERLSEEDLVELKRLSQQSDRRMRRAGKGETAMNLFDFLGNDLTRMAAMPVWGWLLCKITLLLAAAWFMHLALVRANPRWRVFLWRGVAVAMIVLVVGTLGLPGWDIRVPAPTPISVQGPSPLPPLAAARAIEHSNERARGRPARHFRRNDDACPASRRRSHGGARLVAREFHSCVPLAAEFSWVFGALRRHCWRPGWPSAMCGS